MAITTMIGAKIHRREDPRLVRGQGRYTDDFVRPRTTYMSLVRSPHAHARIKSIDTSAANAAPGVLAVYVAEDIEKVNSGTMPGAPACVPEIKPVPDRIPLPKDQASFQ